MLSKSEKLQRSVADFLSRQAGLRGVSVTADSTSSYGVSDNTVTTTSGAITTSTTSAGTKINTNLPQPLGLSIQVKAPTLASATVSGGVITFNNVLVTVRVIDNTPTNVSGMTASEAAEIALKALVTFTADGAGAVFAPDINYAWRNLSTSASTSTSKNASTFNAIVGIDLTVTTTMTL